MDCTGAPGQGAEDAAASMDSGPALLLLQHGRHKRRGADYLCALYLYSLGPDWAGGSETADNPYRRSANHRRQPGQYADPYRESAEPLSVRQGGTVSWRFSPADAALCLRLVSADYALEHCSVQGVQRSCRGFVS